MNRNPLIVALDLESAAQARDLAGALGSSVRFYKVGLELFTAAGPAFVEELLAQGCDVFLDLKFYDIGETVKRAVAQAARLGVRFLTVHASKGVMRAAVEGRGASKLQLLGVTVLTSVDQADLRDDLGADYATSVSDLVALRVRNARELGVDGLVCSPLEVARVRLLAGPDTVLVTPGVRSAGADAGDQKRVATPAQAIANGADYLVIGRQVTRAADPAAEVAKIRAELDAVPAL
jgi:orotidine-5'-phosphate decarboxylase